MSRLCDRCGGWTNRAGDCHRHDVKASLEDRLRAGIVVTASGCWEWQGARSPLGYGRIALAHATSTTTHRVAFRLWVGPTPPGMFVCHRCDNPPCCNPDHLFLGTPDDNAKDASTKGRMAKPMADLCRRGHRLAGNRYVRPDNGKTSCQACINERSLARSRRAAETLSEALRAAQ